MSDPICRIIEFANSNIEFANSTFNVQSFGIQSVKNRYLQFQSYNLY